MNETQKAWDALTPELLVFLAGYLKKKGFNKASDMLWMESIIMAKTRELKAKQQEIDAMLKIEDDTQGGNGR